MTLMRTLASYVMRGPWQAVFVASVLALLSMFPILGFLSILSGAVVALVALRQGFKSGLVVALGASLVVGTFSLLMMRSVGPALVYALLVWAPLLGLAQILRKTASWAITLDVAALLGVAAIVVIYLASGNPVLVWERALLQLVTVMEDQSPGQDFSAFREQIPLFVGWITGFLAGLFVFGMTVSMLLARWWQSVLYNPGGFGSEFRALRASRATSVVVLGVLLLSVVSLGVISDIASDMMMVVLVVYGIFGLGLVHALVAATGRGSGWLIGVYVLAFIALPYVVKILAALGFADSWLDLRSRLGASPGQGPGRSHDDS